MKVVINTCYGGFGLSKEAYKCLGLKWDGYGYQYEEDRTNPKLVKCVEKLGISASGRAAQLKVVKIPDNIKWFITEYDGMEQIEEKHKTWC